MGFGSRRSLIRPRRSRPPSPGREPLGETKRFFAGLASVPKELGISRKPVVRPAPVPQPKPVGRRKPLVQPVELVPVNEDGAEINENAKPGDVVLVEGKPAVVAGRSKGGGLLVQPGPTPAPSDLTDRTNRPQGDGPDHNADVTTGKRERGDA